MEARRDVSIKNYQDRIGILSAVSMTKLPSAVSMTKLPSLSLGTQSIPSLTSLLTPLLRSKSMLTPLPSLQIDGEVSKRYQFVRNLGKGTFGTVWMADEKNNKGQVAIKMIPFNRTPSASKHQPDATKDAQKMFREVAILNLISHPNILPLKNVIVTKNDVYLVSQCMETDLLSLIQWCYSSKDKDKRLQLEENQERAILYQILKAIYYLHSGKIVHWDVKPDNILINSDCTAKLADFGLARTVDTEHRDSGRGSKCYKAPEVLCGGGTYTEKVDLWAFGCILWELLRPRCLGTPARPLFRSEETDMDQLKQIFALLGKPTLYDIQVIKGMDDSLKSLGKLQESKSDPWCGLDPIPLDLLKKLLVYDPNGRINAEEALDHPYFDAFRDDEKPTMAAPIMPLEDSDFYTVERYREEISKLFPPLNIETDTPTENKLESRKRQKPKFTITPKVKKWKAP